METEILIVGAGLAGASTAYYLGRRGVREVLLVEKEQVPDVHSSGRNAALVRSVVSEPDIRVMTTRGAAVLRADGLAPFRHTGSVLIGMGDEQAARHFPLAQGQGMWCPDDGVVEVAALLQTYLASRSVLFNTEVVGIDPSGERLRVHTSRGDILTRVLVNAAGPWAGRLGRLDLTPMNRHVFVTPPREDIGANWPFVWDTTEGLYFRPESGGLLLCACDEQPAAPGDYQPDPGVTDRLHELTARLQPGLGDIAVMNSWVGQRVFARDRKFVIGFDPRDRRVFHVAGLGGHGVTASPAVGRLAADLLVNGEPTQPNPFDPARLISTV
jgi:D-arginine dehydrogenase